MFLESKQPPAPIPRANAVPAPPFRRLRAYAFDPSLSLNLDTAPINEVIFRVPWEPLAPGPVGEYVEVIDRDPASDCFYPPVELDDPHALAQDGLAPSEGSPQFHQQMTYAVAMTTIRHFERALGRRALWSPRWNTAKRAEEFVQRLRLYPHALREANAYYSPQKKALLFGYFPASGAGDDTHIPGETVFTCLSHDIIAHETTHALLDGMHRRFLEPTHPDVLAFHEAFADIVALFQHFTFPEILRHQIAQTRGDLTSHHLLGQLAQEFGKAIGHYGALRDAIGHMNPETKKWEPLIPDPSEYRTVTEPHARGAILVATVFDAFLTIYRNRIADLLRIATGGTGVLPAGALHPDLIARLADEAAKTAQHILTMCIRALDYCPPVDLTFGDYLRALITADADLVPDDGRNYRLAMIEAFRRRGIFPKGLRSFSEESLRWPQGVARSLDVEALAKKLREFPERTRYENTREQIFETTRAARGYLHKLIAEGTGNLAGWERVAGLALTSASQIPGLEIRNGKPVFEIHALRAAQRLGPDGQMLNQVIVTITQQQKVKPKDGRPFIFRGGCTLIFDLDTLRLRYCIAKPIDDDERRTEVQHHLEAHRHGSLRATYFGEKQNAEPFASLHREL